jgi:ABC-type bacteriocin/lantibiotic exporter with double-glycine peptidase domain
MQQTLDQNTKWVILYGYTNTHWLVYDPASNSDEMYDFYSIESAFSIRRR